MTENLQLNTINIPSGMLHDQRLLSANLTDNQLIFSFEIYLNDKEYSGSDFYEKYKRFNRCDMIVQMKNEPINDFYLISSVDKHGKFVGFDMKIDEFISVINKSESAFLFCYTNGFIFRVEFATNFYNSKGMKKYKKYKKYNTCHAEIEAESVSWNWYIK